MSLIDNLNAINSCKEDIKTALVNKGVVMDGVPFSGYAGKIDSLQLEPGEPSTPVISADYVYTNGYIEGGEVNEIINLVPYEIKLDNGVFVLELICPIEIPVFTFENYDIFIAATQFYIVMAFNNSLATDKLSDFDYELLIRNLSNVFTNIIDQENIAE